SREFARQGGVAGLAPDSLGNGGLPLSLDSLAVPGASAASGLRVPEPTLNQGLDGQVPSAGSLLSVPLPGEHELDQLFAGRDQG
ncbi:hypothetical protein ABTP56_18615, partial [Acinetobacter baumannii]